MNLGKTNKQTNKQVHFPIYFLLKGVFACFCSLVYRVECNLSFSNEAYEDPKMLWLLLSLIILCFLSEAKHLKYLISFYIWLILTVRTSQQMLFESCIYHCHFRVTVNALYAFCMLNSSSRTKLFA